MHNLIKIIIITSFSFQVFSTEQTPYSPIKFDAKTEKAFSKNPTITKTKKGLTILNASEGYANVMLSRIGVNGKIETFCTNDKNKAKRFLLGEALETITGRLK